jgi:hypothetical protein
MPTFKTSLITAQEAALVDSSKLVAPTGTVETRRIPYALVGTEGANDLLKIARLPIGAVLLPDQCSVVCEDPGTLLTLDIGTAEDADGLADGIDLSAGRQVDFCSTLPAPAMALTRTPLVSAEIIATVISATALTAGAKLMFNLAWTPARY